MLSTSNRDCCTVFMLDYFLTQLWEVKIHFFRKSSIFQFKFAFKLPVVSTRHVLLQKIRIQNPQDPTSTYNVKIQDLQDPVAKSLRIQYLQGPTTKQKLRIQDPQDSSVKQTKMKIRDLQDTTMKQKSRIQDPQYPRSLGSQNRKKL